MIECTFYTTGTRTHKSENLGGGRNPAEVYTCKLFWCTHKHSPLKKEDIAVCSSALLTCEGDWERCCIPDECRLDFYE